MLRVIRVRELVKARKPAAKADSYTFTDLSNKTPRAKILGPFSGNYKKERVHAVHGVFHHQWQGLSGAARSSQTCVEG